MPTPVAQREAVRLLKEKKRLISERIRRLKKVEDFKKTDIWTALKEEMELSAKSQEFEKDNALDGEKDHVLAWGIAKAARSATKAYRGIIQLIEETEDRIHMLNRQVEEINEKLNEWESEDNKNGGRKIV